MLFFKNKFIQIKVCPRCSAADTAAVEAAAKNAGGTVRYGCIGQCCRDASSKGYVARVDKEVLKAESQEAFMACLNEKLSAQSAH